MQIISWRRWLMIALRLSSPARRRVPPSVPPPSHFNPHSSSPVCLSHLSVCQNDSTTVFLSLSPSCVNILSNFYLFLLSFHVCILRSLKLSSCNSRAGSFHRPPAAHMHAVDVVRSWSQFQGQHQIYVLKPLCVFSMLAFISPVWCVRR